MATFRILESIFEVESHVGLHSTIIPQGEPGSDLEHVIDYSEVIRRDFSLFSAVKGKRSTLS